MHIVPPVSDKQEDVLPAMRACKYAGRDFGRFEPFIDHRHHVVFGRVDTMSLTPCPSFIFCELVSTDEVNHYPTKIT